MIVTFQIKPFSFKTFNVGLHIISRDVKTVRSDWHCLGVLLMCLGGSSNEMLSQSQCDYKIQGILND